MTVSRALLVALLASLVGRTVHDIEEFGAPTADWVVTGLGITILLWLVHRRGIDVAWWAGAWALFNALGAAVTVLPLAWLPFDPAQTASHYAAHAVYLAAQLPLLAWGIATVRSGRIETSQ